MDQEAENEEKTPTHEFKLEWIPDPSAGLEFNCIIPSDFTAGYEIAQGPNDNRRPSSGKILPSHTKHKAQAYTKRSPLGCDYILERKLKEAANNSDSVTVQQLINRGVNPCSADSKQRTALHFAATHGNEHILKLLLDHGANPNAKDTNGNTPLHLAACTNQVKIVTILLRAGTDIHAVDCTGRTPLDVAKSTLRVMQDDASIRTVPMVYKGEVQEIIDMLKEYMNRAGLTKEEKELEELCSKLDLTTTAEQVDQIHDLLSSFTYLSLSRSDKSSC